MSETTLSRRDALKGVGATALVAGASLPVMTRTVLATSSGDPELTVNGTIPSGVTIDGTVDEYDTTDSESPINTQTETVDSGGDPVSFSSIDGSNDYEYDITLDATGDGESTPELELPLRFDIPRDPDDFEFVSYTTEDWDAKPEDVEITWDEYYLRQYQPKVRLPQQSRSGVKGMYGYVAEDENEDTDVLCYWLHLDRFDSLPGGDLGSDLGDHEPIYVFVDRESGEVDRIVYSAFHWEAGEVEPDEDDLETSRTNFPTHATFEVTETWHHYRFNPERDGEFVELKAWPEVRDTWVANNFGASATATQNPWEMLETDTWREESWVSLAGVYIRFGQWFGWYGGDEIDADNLRS